jgi:D-glycero-D-manno-heptose 1,7-bisphosphate phosphatase|tara:strand:- start:404 stop:898 length:495 start_codon:yes stop_codon:yes gene_type:complete
MTKAIFLDRDGVINQERKDYVKKVEEFIILKNVSNAINLIKNHNFLVIIITNQSAVNRKLLTIENLNKIHKNLQEYLKKHNTSFDGIYFCPHRPNENCNCRKPKPGLIIQAVNDFKIEISQSFMIGDSKTDIQAAENAGCKGILLKKNQTLLEAIVDLFESEKI